MTKTKDTDQKITLSEKIANLDEQVDWFYGEDFSLEQASEKYKTAITLAKEIQRDLEELKNEITVIEEDFSRE